MFFKVILENKVCCSPSLVYRAVNMDGIPCPTGTSLCPMRYGASLLHALHFCLLQFMPCPTEWFSCEMCSLTPESNELLCWELSYLSLKLIQSQFVDGGFGLARMKTHPFPQLILFVNTLGASLCSHRPKQISCLIQCFLGIMKDLFCRHPSCSL